MKDYPGYYSLLQYCPDQSRAEVANVGVVLLCPELRFLDAQLAQGNDRVRTVFKVAGDVLEVMNDTKRSFRDRLQRESEWIKSADDLRSFAGGLANDLILTAPRPMRVTEARTDLGVLFAELVGGRKQSGKPRAAIPELERGLATLIAKHLVVEDRRTRINALGTEIQTPYAYKNGIWNLIKPLPLSGDGISSASPWAVRGQFLKNQGDAKLVIVSAVDSTAQEHAEGVAETIFVAHGVDFIRRQNVAGLIERVAAEAHLA